MDANIIDVLMTMILKLVEFFASIPLGPSIEKMGVES
ncbi:hypothetical protein ES708_22760 [subsurface metagenome]